MRRCLAAIALACAAAGPAAAEPDLFEFDAPTPTPSSLAMRADGDGGSADAPVAEPQPQPQQRTFRTRIRDAFAESFLELPRGIKDVQERVVFHLDIGFALDGGEPVTNAQLASGQPLIEDGDRAFYERLRVYTFGDAVIGSRGFLVPSLASRFEAVIVLPVGHSLVVWQGCCAFLLMKNPSTYSSALSRLALASMGTGLILLCFCIARGVTQGEIPASGDAGDAKLHAAATEPEASDVPPEPEPSNWKLPALSLLLITAGIVPQSELGSPCERVSAGRHRTLSSVLRESALQPIPCWLAAAALLSPHRGRERLFS